jgi:DNA-binding beta-propeller fold protein YncE
LFSRDLFSENVSCCWCFYDVILKIEEGDKLKIFTIILLITFLFIGCDIESGIGTGNTTKIYSGSYGYNVAYRVEGNKVYSGSYGYDVVYRIDGNKIYSGAYGYNVAYRVDGNKVYSGSYGYSVAFRVDGDKIYSGSFGYDVAYRVGR